MKRLLPVLPLLLASAALASPEVRVKDLATVEGVRSNPLYGYGLVVGLQGTGDGTQADFTVQSIANLLRRNGVAVPQNRIRVRNVAAVMVTAELPPFARPGQTIDIQISSLGDAKSLQGGTLLLTALQGPDGLTYAVAQGPMSLGGGFSGGGGGNGTVKNHPTAGTIPGGAVVERAVPQVLAPDGLSFRLLLNRPDFITAWRVAKAVNDAFGQVVARAEDAGAVRLLPPANFSEDPVGLLARVETVQLRPDETARVVINERTGTVVLGSDVKVSKVAVAHGNLSVEVRTTLEASQPAPFSERGRTVIVPNRQVNVDEEPSKVLTLEDGTTVGDVVNALNRLGVSARDMIAIFQAMRGAGALHAELVIQ